jgi:hypothetical protein
LTNARLVVPRGDVRRGVANRLQRAQQVCRAQQHGNRGAHGGAGDEDEPCPGQRGNDHARHRDGDEES